MKKILAVGIGPLLEPGVRKIGGQCLRTWHFVKPIIDRGDHVRLYTIPIPDRDLNLTDLPVEEKKDYKGFDYTCVNRHDLVELTGLLERAIEEFKPDVLLGINSFPSRALAAVKSRLPLWVDLNGYTMVEGQTKCRLYQRDDDLRYFWDQEIGIVRRADKFSVVSKPQMYALLGELAFAGRLNRWTFDYEFVHWTPNAVNEMYTWAPSSHDKVLRGVVVPEDAFIILWSGGFNTWTDVEFLYRTVTAAMERYSSIHFVATGGMVDGHDELTYRRFQNLIDESPFRDKFHLQGWIDAELIPSFYAESDLGINVDSFNYETVFGARNRLVNMMAMGLGVLTTLGTEISHVIAENDLGSTTPIGDEEQFVAALCEAVAQPERGRWTAHTAREYVLRHFSYHTTTQDLQKWLDNPAPSPDNIQRRSSDQPFVNEIESMIDILSPDKINKLHEAAEELDRIKSKRLYKVYKSIKNIFF